MLSALTIGAPVHWVNWLASLYILLRIAHGLFYISNKPALRSAAYVAAMAVNIAIFVLPAFR